MKPPNSTPTLEHEKKLWDEGYELVCGVDEVGKGAWAGPLSVGFAIPGPGPAPAGINDSKALSEKRREEIFDEVAEWCSFWSVGYASPKECDELGMSEAQKLATSRALQDLGVRPDWALVDGHWNFMPEDMVESSTTLIKGDTRSIVISAASILAKVTRDRLMREVGDSHGPYRFGNNKGYRCGWHVHALKAWGPTPIHRTSWSFMEEVDLTFRHSPNMSANMLDDMWDG